MSTLLVLAKITAQEGKRADLIEALGPMLDHVETEEGTVHYVLCKDTGDEDVVWVYERYTDEAALAAHGSSDAMKAVGGSIGSLVAGPPEITVLAPVGGKGL